MINYLKVESQAKWDAMSDLVPYRVQVRTVAYTYTLDHPVVALVCRVAGSSLKLQVVSSDRDSSVIS